MAPQARLTFTPSSPLASQQAAPALLSSFTKHEKPLPTLSPTFDCTGDFSLLRGGGVKVGVLKVAIQRGTTVARASTDECASASGGDALRWKGHDEVGTAGAWSLYLVGATEADVEAIHRALLFLPPSHALPPAHTAHPAPVSPPPIPHSYRNSLLLYSPIQRSIISVLPLPQPSAPYTQPSAPSPTHHPSPSDFAAYIDHLVEEISLDPTREVLERERRDERRRREEVARMEEEGLENGWEEGEPMLDFLVLPEAEARMGAGGVDGRKRKAHRKSFERLDLEMDLASNDLEMDLASNTSQAPPPRVSPAAQRLRPTSMLSVSSFATFGSERFVTADEGESSDEDGGGTIRSMATRQRDAAASDRTSGAAKAATAPMRLRDPSFDPPHTLTNGNAVLLSFLGATSTFSPFAKPDEAASGFNLTARRLSPQEVERLSEHGQIEVAQIEVEQEQLAALEQGEQDHRGWWSWLFGPVGGKQDVEAEEEQVDDSSSASSWLAWFASVFLPPQASSTSGGRALRRSRTARAAAGETTSRLSVFCFDEAGRGGQAFFVARGEQEL